MNVTSMQHSRIEEYRIRKALDSATLHRGYFSSFSSLSALLSRELILLKKTRHRMTARAMTISKTILNIVVTFESRERTDSDPVVRQKQGF